MQMGQNDGNSDGDNTQTMIAVYALSATGGIILLCIVYAFCCRAYEDEHDLLPTRSASSGGSSSSCPWRSKNVKLCKLPSHTRLAVMPGQQVQLAVRATPSPSMCATPFQGDGRLGPVYFEPPIRGVEGGQIRPSSVRSGTEDDSMFMYQASSFGDHPMFPRGFNGHLNLSGRYDWRDYDSVTVTPMGFDNRTDGSRTPSHLSAAPRAIAAHLNISGRYNWREQDISHLINDDNQTEASTAASASVKSHPRQLAAYLNVSGRHYFRDAAAAAATTSVEEERENTTVDDHSTAHSINSHQL